MRSEDKWKSNYLIIKHRQIDIQMLVCWNIFDTFFFTSHCFHAMESDSKIIISKNLSFNCVKERKCLKNNNSNIDENKCLIIEPDQYLYFNQSTLTANLTLKNKCQDTTIQFKLMCNRNDRFSVWPNSDQIDPNTNVQCLFSLQMSSSPPVLLVDEEKFFQRSLKSDSTPTNNLNPSLSQFQMYIQWKHITPDPVITYYRKLYCFIIAKRSSSYQRAISTPIWKLNAFPYGISILIAFMFGYIFGRFYN
jgi:hypothetical protein